MSKGKKAKLPPAPDPSQLIAQQAQVNRVNQTTPFGKVSFSGPNRSNLNFSLTPELQALLNTQVAGGREAAGAGGEFLRQADFDPLELEDTEAFAQGFFDLGASRLEPFFDRRRAATQERLTQLGNPAVGADLAPGAVSELDLIGRQENQALTDLTIQSMLAGPQAQGQILSNQANALGTNINSGLSLLSGSPVGIPGPGSFFNVPGVDVMGPNQLALNQAQAQANLQREQNSSFFGGLFDLGTSLLPFVPLPTNGIGVG